MSLINGPIYVIDYSGKQIIEDVIKEICSDKKEKTNKDTAVNGIIELSLNGGMLLTAEADNNIVTLKTRLIGKPLTLSIKVPIQFSLK